MSDSKLINYFDQFNFRRLFSENFSYYKICYLINVSKNSQCKNRWSQKGPKCGKNADNLVVKEKSYIKPILTTI